jgi:chromate transport protein ChrA
LIIVFLANLILRYYDNPHLQGAFRWVRAIVVGMIAAAAVKMGKPCLRNKMQIGLVAVALLLAIVQVHPVLLIVGGALAGWLLTQPDRESHQKGAAS